MKINVNVIAGLAGVAAVGLSPITPAIASIPAGNLSPGSAARQDRGMSPHQVALVQEALDSTGAHLRINGVWGHATEAALKHYQRENGLAVTGRLDTATRSLLDPIG